MNALMTNISNVISRVAVVHAKITKEPPIFVSMPGSESAVAFLNAMAYVSGILSNTQPHNTIDFEKPACPFWSIYHDVASDMLVGWFAAFASGVTNVELYIIPHASTIETPSGVNITSVSIVRLQSMLILTECAFAHVKDWYIDSLVSLLKEAFSIGKSNDITLYDIDETTKMVIKLLNE